MNKVKFIIRGSLSALIVFQVVQSFTEGETSPPPSPLVKATRTPSVSGPRSGAIVKYRDRIHLLSRQLVEVGQDGEKATAVANELEEVLVRLFEDGSVPLDRKIKEFEQLTDVDLADRVLSDVIAATTRVLPLEQALGHRFRLDPEGKPEILEEFVAARFEVEPGETLRWLEEKSEAGLKRDLLPELVSQWAVSNTEETARFLEQLPVDDEASDLAIGLFVHTVLRQRPDLATHFAARVRDSEYRDYLEEEIALLGGEE